MRERPVFPILFAVSAGHLMNDLLQALIPASYPLFQSSFQLSYSQLGLITLIFNITASLLQPFVGAYTDKHPMPFSLIVGMGATLSGVLLLAFAPSYPIVLAAAALVGSGSSIFHPEAARVIRYAAASKLGLAQAMFQLGGNAGSAAGPLLAALILARWGQRSIAIFSAIPLVAMALLYYVAGWYAEAIRRLARNRTGLETALPFSKNRTILAVAVLITLVFSKGFYMASITNYFAFFAMQKFGLTVQEAQFRLFAISFAHALGTFIGGPIGDRYGRRLVIWISILGTLPFALALPHVDLFWTTILGICAAGIIASGFSAILIFALELIPGRVGVVSGLHFGFAFGMGGLGAAALGRLADARGLEFTFLVCSFLPALGLLTIFLPDAGKKNY